jgi:hypothetical protein
MTDKLKASDPADAPLVADPIEPKPKKAAGEPPPPPSPPNSPTVDDVMPKVGQQNSVGQESTNATKYTIHDVLEKIRAKEAGQEDPYPDLPQEHVELAVRSGIVPAGTGTAGGRVLRPNEAPRPIQGLGTYGTTESLTPDQAVNEYGGEPVDMVFPRPVRLTTDDRRQISYPAGTHAVPASLASHSYLAANGVKAAETPEQRAPETILSGSEKTAPRK